LSLEYILGEDLLLFIIYFESKIEIQKSKSRKKKRKKGKKRKKRKEKNLDEEFRVVLGKNE